MICVETRSKAGKTATLVKGIELDETPVTLLQRLRGQADPKAWQRLVELYTPLLQIWLRRHLVQDADSDDLVQEVLAVLIREVPQFQHNGQRGAFRTWLRALLVNRLRVFWRKRALTPDATGDSGFLLRLSELEDPHSPLSDQWNEEHDRQVVRRCLQMVASDFEATTWQAFHRLTLDGLRRRGGR